MSAEEDLILEITGFISELVPINVEQTKNRLSHLMKEFYIQKVESEEVHPDLTEKIEMYFYAKKLEGFSESTVESYGFELKTFSNTVKKRVEDVTTSDIRTYLGSFQNLKMTTIGKKLAVLKSFFGWLYGEEFLDRDPTVKLKAPKVEKRLPKALTIPELEMLREACKTVRQRAFIEVLYATGCRLAEVQGLNKDQINRQGMSTFVIGKGDKEREVYFSFKAMYHLEKYLSQRQDDCEALFITERKPFRRLTKGGIQREVKIIAGNAGLAHKVSFHVLRHTFATLTLNNGAELVAVQELLGHSSPETTLKYARITEERKREQHKKYLVQ